MNFLQQGMGKPSRARSRRWFASAGAVSLLLTIAAGARAATSMAFEPSSGSPGTQASLTIQVDVQPNPGARVYVNAIPRGSTITHDPNAWGIGEALFDASGTAVLAFVVPTRPAGVYETELGCGDCSDEFGNALPPDALFEITDSSGGLPNTATLDASPTSNLPIIIGVAALLAARGLRLLARPSRRSRNRLA